MSFPRSHESDMQAARGEAVREAAGDFDEGARDYREFKQQLEADPTWQRCWSREGARQADTPDWRDTVIEKERQEWQPEVVQPDGAVPPAAEAKGPEISG